jgi:tetratricopeptide (TPR) repeat protein
MNISSIVIFLVVFAYAMPASAQDERTLDYLRQEAQRKRSELLRQLDSGVYYMEQEQYVLADEKFKQVLQSLNSVPSDLTFFFGKNSFFLSHYKQSIDWLNKYIQLKGTTGQYYEEALEWLKKAEAQYLEEKSGAAEKTQQILSRNYDIDCGPTGKVTCPVCQGNHVIVKKGPFGDSFRTCPYCNEHGILTCEQYNQLLRGELQPGK